MIKTMDFRLFLILLMNIGLISAGEWSDVVFTKPDEFPCGDETNCPNWNYKPETLLNTAYIKFKEELEEPILIAYLYCTDCSSESPQIGAFETGSKTTLGPEIEKVSEGKYSLTIKNRLDFETADQRQFAFTISLNGAGKTARVKIDLLDTDDNPPIVTIDHTPCVIEENYHGETDCTFSITDPDTIHKAESIKLSIPDEYEAHFEMKLDKINDNNAKATLKVRKENPLDFEKMPMYFFELTAEDLGENKGSSFVTITVQDVNDQAPRWINIFAMKSFNEKIEQEFEVSARDGDLGIDDTIIYKWKDDYCHESIKLVPSGENAKIKIDPINRDTQEMEDNDNTIKCTLIASEKSSNKYNTPTEISFIIQDINDNKPLITMDPKYEKLIKLREQEFTTLDKIFRIEDIDQGNNAQFDVTLQNTAGANIKIDYTEHFQVIPNNGYKKWDFAISVTDQIDYDRNEDWRKFSLTIHSEDKGDKPMVDDKTINIELINLNDEKPVFDTKTSYSVDINEDAKKGTYILNVLATDADEDDYITYDISAETDYELSIHDNKSATIYTKGDNVFDYEKVKVVYIQIYATDNLIIPGEEDKLTTVTQQITVNVKDVNDEKPIINLPSETDPIEEHSDINTEVTRQISARDVDTTAHLVFNIDWENSKASKSGVKITNINLFKDVFSIETNYPDENKKGQAIGILKVKNKKALDYEEFDTILLNIKVTDKDQPEPDNTDEGTMTITIGDKNDNAPEFKPETIESEKVIEEHSKSQFRIGQIVAFDIDGPGNNDITYKLDPREGTEPGLVKIDPETGELTVDADEKIDADYPNPIKYLYYTVTASDNDDVHSTPRDIKIKVEDINDKIPFLKEKLVDDSIKERKSTDEKECLKQKIQGHDDDRDAPHNKVRYYINNEINPQLSQMFEIDPDTGVVCARGDIEWKSNQKDIKVYIILEDNYKGSGVPNTHKVNFTVKITDIDNNPPVLPEENTYNVMENIKTNEEIAKFIATDKDEPCTETTKIKYSIEEVKHNRGIDITADIFELSEEEGPAPKCEQIAKLKVAKSLKDYYGKITVTIRAQNVGNKNNYDIKSYEINVKPYNYKPPVIRIPDKPTLILKKEQEANKQLKYIDGRSVEDFEADDDQGGKFEMSFKPGKIWDDNFKLLFPNPDGEKNKARLTLTNTNLDPKDYTLQIIAYHMGEGSKNDVDKTITIKFVDSDQLPGFNGTVTDTVEFWENSIKPDNECQPFQEASDPKCVQIEECDIFYHIINVEEKRYFRTEKGTPPKLCLNVKLDREDQAYHNLIIVATNNDVAPSKVPEDYTPLKLTVKVKDINDNPPAFDTKLFKGGLSDTQKIDSVIVTLKASDPDEVDENKLTYKIVEISVSDPTLTNVKDSAFKLEKDEIKNLIQPTQVMKGHFLFTVRVYDSFETHFDTAEVKIHIISDANRVIFEFSDDIDAVKLKEEEMREIFSKQFGYTCIIDDISKKVNETTTRETTYITEVKTHFIDESIDEPVDKEVITTKLEDLAIIGRLQSRLEDINLTLISIENNENEITNEMEDMNYLLKILLIVVSVVLGTLCIILIIAFILRSRSLNKRLEAMTTNVFGSTKSDLNRIGTSAPGANRHAIEANPIWSEDLNHVNQFDTISQGSAGSGGSDLIGVEDKPDFAYDFRRASINPIIQQSLHNMSQQDDDINSLPGFNNNNGIDNKSYEEYDFRRASINPVIQQNLHNMSEQNDDDDIRSLPGSNDGRSRF